MNPEQTLELTILDKRYHLQCTSEDMPHLQAAAKYLDERLKTVRDGGRVIGLDRIAITVALNIAYELLQAKKKADDPEYRQSLKNCHDKIDRCLATLT